MLGSTHLHSTRGMKYLEKQIYTAPPVQHTRRVCWISTRATLLRHVKTRLYVVHKTTAVGIMWTCLGPLRVMHLTSLSSSNIAMEIGPFHRLHRYGSIQNRFSDVCKHHVDQIRTTIAQVREVGKSEREHGTIDTSAPRQDDDKKHPGPSVSAMPA